MIYGSVSSGIEAATVAWHELGWVPAWFAEIATFPNDVLAHHYPHVPNLGDMTKIRDKIATGEVAAPDVLVGGTPCQAFSVAGLRNSLDDDRGQLTLEFVRIANEIDSARLVRGEQPCIAVWENVPGVLNTKDNAFGCFLGALAGSGCELQPPGKRWGNSGCIYGPERTVAWRVLDAQYFGLAQRRKRVFVIASARAGFDSSEVLLEWEGVRRDIAPSRGKRKETSTDARSSIKVGSHWDDELNPHPTLNQSHNTGGIGSSNQEIFCQRGCGIVPVVVHCAQEAVYTIKGNIIGRQDNFCGNGFGVGRDISYTLTRTDVHAIFQQNTRDEVRFIQGAGQIAGALVALAGMKQQNYLFNKISQKVRRLTPIECERLQGFPDNYTQIPYRNKPAEQCPDGPRYAALGNSMAVPVMRWIGNRIAQYIAKRMAA